MTNGLTDICDSRVTFATENVAKDIQILSTIDILMKWSDLKRMVSVYAEYDEDETDEPG